MSVSAIYSDAVERVLFPFWEGVVRRRPTLEIRRHLERSQWRPLDELEAQRRGALRRLIEQAVAHVPYYRRLFAEAGLRASDIRTVEDLAKVPLLTRDRAIDSYPVRASEAPPLADIRKNTGGTTGQPMQFGYDLDSEYWRQAVKLRGWGWGGYRVGGRVLHYWGTGAPLPWKKRVRTELDRALKRERYVDCTRRSEEDMQRAVQQIERFRPEVLIAFTQAAVELARYINDRGARRWDPIPVLCCAERLYPADRPLLEQAFGPPFETYGCREVMLIGSECEVHDGLHLSSENLIVELIVRENGRERPAQPGEPGEVVLTDLHNFGMPFIRYVNGDLAVAAAPGACACGRSLPRLASVEGRVAETLTDARGGRVGGLTFNVIFTPLAHRVRQFQAVQHKDGAVTLKLVPHGQQLTDDELADIRRRLRDKIPSLQITPLPVDEIPLTAAGKRRVVVVER